MSDYVRIGLGLVALSWIWPAWAIAWAFWKERPQSDALLLLLLVHRTTAGVFLALAAALANWTLVWAAGIAFVLSALAVEVVKRRWPRRWEMLGE
jgi:hypothetical protein